GNTGDELHLHLRQRLRTTRRGKDQHHAPGQNREQTKANRQVAPPPTGYGFFQRSRRVLHGQLPLQRPIARLQRRMASSFRFLPNQIEQVNGRVRRGSRDGNAGIGVIERFIWSLRAPNRYGKASLSQGTKMTIDQVGKILPLQKRFIQLDNEKSNGMNLLVTLPLNRRYLE